MWSDRARWPVAPHTIWYPSRMTDGGSARAETPGAHATWGSFYSSGADLETFFTTLAYHAPMMRRILQAQPRTALEGGCGSAVMASFLRLVGIQTVAVDNDTEVLEAARQGAANWPVQPEFVLHDIFDLTTLGRNVDVVFSQGVLEHFSDEQIGELCQQALAVAPQFVFSVPSKHYGHRDFGNERLMTAEQWRRILQPHGQVHVEEYFLARRRYTLGLRKPLMILATVTRA